MISYKLYKATTDPDAERFVQEQKANRAKIEAYETGITDASGGSVTDASGNTDISGTILSPPPQSLITEIIKNIVFSFFVFLFILFIDNFQIVSTQCRYITYLIMLVRICQHDNQVFCGTGILCT